MHWHPLIFVMLFYMNSMIFIYHHLLTSFTIRLFANSTICCRLYHLLPYEIEDGKILHFDLLNRTLDLPEDEDSSFLRTQTDHIKSSVVETPGFVHTHFCKLWKKFILIMITRCIRLPYRPAEMKYFSTFSTKAIGSLIQFRLAQERNTTNSNAIIAFRMVSALESTFSFVHLFVFRMGMF